MAEAEAAPWAELVAAAALDAEVVEAAARLPRTRLPSEEIGAAPGTEATGADAQFQTQMPIYFQQVGLSPNAKKRETNMGLG